MRVSGLGFSVRVSGYIHEVFKVGGVGKGGV